MRHHGKPAVVSTMKFQEDVNGNIRFNARKKTHVASKLKKHKRA